jgi:alpha-tubulin suppressor-like RCC1 family protein
VGVFDGEVWCWGSNSKGQLGDGTTTNRLKPVKVRGLSTNVVDIALGSLHTCALTSAGRVECWGSNGSGQLGDGTKVDRLEPVEVWKLKGVTSITAGFAHTCARTSGAIIKCWGLNLYGQLGDGTTESRSLAAAVRGLAEGALHVAARELHTCAVTLVNRAAMCWGRNRFGQLGDGTTLDRVKPRHVITLRKEVTAITLGANHTCALKDDRIAKCWGSNSSGQLGDGTKTNQLIPVTVLGFK